MEQEGLEVGRFRHGRVYGVIRPLEALEEQAGVSAAFCRSPCDGGAQGVGFQMMGAGAGHEHSAGPDEVEPQFIDAGIRFKALTRVLLALDEGRGIDAERVHEKEQHN